MTDQVKLIAGLGNPGQQYDGTRHNAGADLVSAIARDCGTALTSESRFFGRCARVNLAGKDVRLLVPDTYMNRSGQAVAAMLNFYKFPVTSLLVVHDELDLPPGVARFKHGGGHGGHNGLRDIIKALGNDASFSRLRVGIGHPGSAKEVTGYVLRKASSIESARIEEAATCALRVLPQVVAGDWANATNELHSATRHE